MKTLLDLGADKTIRDRNGKLPVDYARECKLPANIIAALAIDEKDGGK
jgi:hypothetical protein